MWRVNSVSSAMDGRIIDDAPVFIYEHLQKISNADLVNLLNELYEFETFTLPEIGDYSIGYILVSIVCFQGQWYKNQLLVAITKILIPWLQEKINTDGFVILGDYKIENL